MEHEQNYLLTEYRTHATLERTLRPRTVGLFSFYVGQFLNARWLDTNGREMAYAIDAQGVKAFILTLQRNAPATVRSKLTALKNFAEWLHKMGLLSEVEHARIRAIKGPKLPERLPTVFTEEQVTRLLEAPSPPPPNRG